MIKIHCKHILNSQKINTNVILNMCEMRPLQSPLENTVLKGSHPAAEIFAKFEITCAY